MLLRRLLVAVTALLLHQTALLADSRRVIEYSYDAAGNIIRIEAEAGDQPPVVDVLTPERFRIGPAVNMLASGIGLRNAQVSVDGPGIRITSVQSDSTTVAFNIQASSQASPGDYSLIFTTSLGSATAGITVLPRLPILFVSPAPIAVSATGPPREIDIRLSSTDIVDNTVNLNTGDASIATITPGSITIPAGQLRSTATITLSGVSLGQTALTIASDTLEDFSTGVYVTEEFVPPTGDNNAISMPLGVFLTPPPQPPELEPRGPVISHLGIVKSDTPVPDSGEITPIVAPLLGVNRGSALTGLDPDYIVVGEGPIDLTLNGIGLDTVSAVSIEPADGITLGTPNAATDGGSVTVPVSVDPDAALGARRVVVENAAGRIQPLTPEADQLLVTRPPPSLVSIDPVVLTRLSIATLTLRGKDFQNVTGVDVIPAEGVTLGSTIEVSDDGSIINIELTISELAALGKRVVTVTTPSGATSPIASAANTIEIVNGPVTRFSPIVSPLLGLVKGEAGGQAADAIDDIRSGLLGVAHGGVITGLSPSRAAIGETFSLTINGNGLENVIAATFEPDDGITAGPLTVAPDGTAVSMTVTLAQDAPQTVRRVRVSTATASIAASPVDSDRFEVTGLVPTIDSIEPLSLVRGAAASDFLIRGRNLVGTDAVRLIPAADISVGPPSVNGAGTEVTVTLLASADAATGERVIVIESPAGESLTDANDSNTITVVNEVTGTVSPVITPLLGVSKGELSPVDPEPEDRLILAPHLGVVLEAPPPGPGDPLPLFSPELRVARAPVAFGITPPGAAINSMIDLVIEGESLGDIASVIISPDQGITRNAAPAVSTDGTQVTLPISVAGDALQTFRNLRLFTAAGAEIPFQTAAAGRLLITGPEPMIDSIAPIQEVAGETFDLIVRGINLIDVVSIDATPADGISFGTPIGNADGTEITVQVNLAADAPAGQRVITVTTPAGTTADEPGAENTFTVLAP